MAVYKLIWDDFCSWYLELVKPPLERSMSTADCEATVAYFESLMKLLHPFMPFITEEVWQQIGSRNKGESIMVASWPAFAVPPDKQILKDFQDVMSLITEIRNIRKTKNIPNRETLKVYADDLIFLAHKD